MKSITLIGKRVFAIAVLAFASTLGFRTRTKLEFQCG